MNVEVEIYVSNIVKFFNNNPKDLSNLVPIEKKDEFYSKIKNIAESNYDKGDDPSLTKQQFIDICLEINGKSVPKDVIIEVVKEISGVIIQTKWGNFSLN